MINIIKRKIKRIFFLNNLIIKVKFLFYMGLEKEAHYLKNNYRFNNSVDVGSNTGHFTNMLSKISKKVYSFEPIYYLNKKSKILI